MKTEIRDMAKFGLALRAARRASHVRLDDLAALTGLSKQFVSDAEHGKPTLQMGLVFKLLAQIGAHLQLDLPESAVQGLRRLQAQGGVKPYRRQMTRKADGLRMVDAICHVVVADVLARCESRCCRCPAPGHAGSPEPGAVPDRKTWRRRRGRRTAQSHQNLGKADDALTSSHAVS